MRFLVIFLLLMGPAVCLPQLMINVCRDTFEVRTYAEGDEFNSLQLDEKKWKNGLGGRRVLMVQDLAFEPENVRLESGFVKFIAKKKDTTYTLFDYEVDSNSVRKRGLRMQNNRFSIKYSVGGIVSRDKHHYGLYELRFKVQEGTGIWPAFWFYGGEKNEEIDVFELKGERNNEVHVDTHCPSGCAHGYRKTPFSLGRSFGSWMKVSSYLHEGFNTVMLDWRKDELYWYLNGYPMAYFRGEFPNPMNLFLNTSVAMTGEAFSPGPDASTPWPNIYLVDYLRIWRQSESDILPVTKELSASSSVIDSVMARPVKKRGVAYRKKSLRPKEGFIALLNTPTGLKVSISGPIAEQSGFLSITGQYTRYDIPYSDNGKIIQTHPRDTALTLNFSSSRRRFSYTFSLK